MPARSKSKPKLKYDCSKCPAYCCAYEHIPVTKRDIARLAKHHGLTPEVAEKRFTKKVPDGYRVLRHQKDTVYKTACRFLDLETRRCTIYDARPTVCRTYPEGVRCGYYEFLMWERDFQGDDDFVPTI